MTRSLARAFAACAVAAAAVAPACATNDLTGQPVAAEQSCTIGLPTSAAPEPGNLALLLAGLGACACTALRRRG
jgi:hypothetical protein